MKKSQPLVNYRQKTLLSLLSALGGRASKTDFQKYLFLYVQEFEQAPSFEFVPYKFGCFSFQSYADKRRLVEIGALQDADDWRLMADFRIKSATNSGFDEFISKHGKLKGDHLVRYVYKNYPYYATHSEIAEKLLTPEYMDLVISHRFKFDEPCFFTIGYEGSSFEG